MVFGSFMRAVLSSMGRVDGIHGGSGVIGGVGNGLGWLQMPMFWGDGYQRANEISVFPAGVGFGRRDDGGAVDWYADQGFE